MLARLVKYFNVAYAKEDVKCCKMLLSCKSAYENRCINNNTRQCISTPNKHQCRTTTNDNQDKGNGMTCMPLLAGEVTFSRRSSRCLPLFHKELEARSVLLIDTSANAGIRMLIKLLHKAEHLELSQKDKSELNDKEGRELRHFESTLLTTVD